MPKPKSTAEIVHTGVIILAAGQGKRMRSSLPKVLHAVGGQSMVFHILNKVKEVSPRTPVSIVVGHGRELVETAVRGEFTDMDITFVEQPFQGGTGHAARCAMDSAWGESMTKKNANVLVLPGDLPLITRDMVEQMLAPLGKSDSMRLLTCVLPEPKGYGRIVRRGKSGPVLRITEEKDANAREKEIQEVAVSIYTFRAPFMKAGLSRLSNKNAQKEYYLTDLVSQASRAKKGIDVLIWAHNEELRGVNDPWELAQAGRLLNERCLRTWSLQGVKFIDPSCTWVDCTVHFEEEVVVHPGAVISGKTKIGRGAMIGPHVVLKNMEIGAEAQIKTGTVGENSRIGAKAQVGPYAHFRPESVVGEASKIGNFVELKKSVIGAHTSISHLSYLGDAEVGNNVNIGCGFVTCNFDGRVINGSRKHKTVIEDNVFMGSDCQTVAPLRVGKGSFVASGSTLTEDVAPESLAIARTRQVNKPGYAAKLRETR